MQIGFLGGDRRMEIAAEILKEKGHNVRFPSGAHPEKDFFTSLDLLVLPYPATRDGVCVTATNLPLASLPLEGDTSLFGGRLPAFLTAGRRAFDAEEDEEYLQGNAYLTAAAGVATALRAGERAFFRVKAAVLGYGRIGKETAKMLRALGAQVCVYVRREAACEAAEKNGHTARLLKDTTHIPADLVFGTVPAPAENLAKLTVDPTTHIYDLGGGLPDALPTKTGDTVKTLPLRGAPGVFAPRAAGELYGGAILGAIARLTESTHANEEGSEGDAQRPFKTERKSKP